MTESIKKLQEQIAASTSAMQNAIANVSTLKKIRRTFAKEVEGPG